MTDEAKLHSAQPPYLMAALLCDDTLEEKDGRLSLLRLVSEVKVQVESSKPPSKMPAIPIALTMVLSFNAGGRPGSYEAELRIISPDATERIGPKMPFELPHDSFAMNVIAKMQMEAKTVGVYWIAVLLGGSEVTRIPLNVQYVSKRIESSTPASGDEQNLKPGKH